MIVSTAVSFLGYWYDTKRNEINKADKYLTTNLEHSLCSHKIELIQLLNKN